MMEVNGEDGDDILQIMADEDVEDLTKGLDDVSVTNELTGTPAVSTAKDSENFKKKLLEGKGMSEKLGMEIEEPMKNEVVGKKEKLWDVEKILKKKVGPDGSVLYRVKWVGWNSKHNTWEPPQNLVNCIELVKFERKEKRMLLPQDYSQLRQKMQLSKLKSQTVDRSYLNNMHVKTRTVEFPATQNVGDEKSKLLFVLAIGLRPKKDVPPLLPRIKIRKLDLGLGHLNI